MSGKTFAYVGHWTVKAKEPNMGGITIYQYNESDGTLTYVDTVRTDLCAGQMCIDHRRGVLYAIDEAQNSPAFAMQGGGGRVVAFSIDRESGRLTELGAEQPTFGTLTTYAALDGRGEFLVVANHGDKQAITKTARDPDGTYRVVTDFSEVNAVLYPLAGDGAVLPACDMIPFAPDRSQYPARIACLHSVYFAHDGEHCIMTNMKQDQIMMLRVNREKKKLEICDVLDCPKGNWPRYGAFHPTRPLFYLNNEHGHEINVVRYSGDWKLEIIQTVKTAPEGGYPKTPKAAAQTEIRISADGRFVYNVIRGVHQATVLAVDKETGLLELVQRIQLRGEGPRDFDISPDGRFLLIGNLESGEVSTVAVGADGLLTDSGVSDKHVQYPGAVYFYRS